MVDFNGGGGVIGIPGIGAPIGPAMSADQINSNILGNAAIANQNALNNAYGPGGFGGATAANAKAGAAALGAVGAQMTDNVYGVSGDLWSRMSPSDRSAFNGQMGGGSVFDTGAAPFNDYGGGANPGGFSPSPNYPGGNGPGSVFDTGAPELQGGGGLGDPGFGIGQPNYTGQPGHGLGIGTVGPAAGPLQIPSGFQGFPDYPGSDVMGGKAFEMPSNYPRDFQGYGDLSLTPAQTSQLSAPDLFMYGARNLANAANTKGAGPVAIPDWMRSATPIGSTFDQSTYGQSGGDTFNSRFDAAPAVDPALQGDPGGYLPQGIFDGVFAPTTPNSPPANFDERFGVFGDSGSSGATDFSGQSRAQSSLEPWTSSIPSNVNSQELYDAIHSGSAVNKMDPNAYAALVYQESGWDPSKGKQNNNYGMGQIAPDDFQLGDNGKLGGLTREQYVGASPAQQVAAHADLLNRVLQKAGIDMSQYDAPTQYALAQAINFGPWSQAKWLPQFLAGDYSAQTGPPQGDPGGPLYDTSIANMRANYNRIANGWAQP